MQSSIKCAFSLSDFFTFSSRVHECDLWTSAHLGQAASSGFLQLLDQVCAGRAKSLSCEAIGCTAKSAPCLPTLEGAHQLHVEALTDSYSIL